MEEKIKAVIAGIFRQYGCDRATDAPAKKDRILRLCMEDLLEFPDLEKELDAGVKIHYFVMQTILSDIPAREEAK